MTQELMNKALDLHRQNLLDDAARCYEQVLQHEPDNPEALYLYGVLHFQSGRPQPAVALLDRVLAREPSHVDAHVHRGLSLQALGRYAEALESYELALERNPDVVLACFNRANLLSELGRYQEATEGYRRVITLRPDLAEAYCNCGRALYGLGRYVEALEWYAEALERKPDFALACYNRGNALQALGRLEAAVADYTRTIAIDPDFASAYNNRGNVLHDLGRYEAALGSYARAIQLQPDYPSAFSNRGTTLQTLGRLEDALKSYDRAIELDPDCSMALSNRGITLQQLGRHDEALQSYERAIALAPGYTEAYLNRGLALHEQHRFREALQSYDRALELQPSYAEAFFNKSLTQLTLGDYSPQVWSSYAWRWKTKLLCGVAQPKQPLWTGQFPLAGRTILLHAEQGLGDTIQFSRYVPMVAALGARVLLEVDAALVGLFAGLPGIAEIVSHGQVLPPFDCHCPLLSLPQAFGTTLETIPPPASFSVDPVLAEHFGRLLGPRTRPRVGLVWNGGFRSRQSELAAVSKRRDIGIEAISRLNMPGIEFVSLQKGEPSESEFISRYRKLWPDGNMVALADRLHDFADTAALVSQLDLVVAVDTSVAHLAASMGKPVWLLNRFDSCWRWLLERQDSPWYPEVRLYRQERPGDWVGVLHRVAADLAALFCR